MEKTEDQLVFYSFIIDFPKPLIFMRELRVQDNKDVTDCRTV